MSSLKYFNSILDTHHVKKLKKHNIKTVTDFVQETPENLCKIMELNFKYVLEVKHKLLNLCRRKPFPLSEILSNESQHRYFISRKISEIEKIVGKFEPGNIYEICGLSGAGKTQICLSVIANLVMNKECVHYIDTKGDFSATKFREIISSNQKSEVDIVSCMERVKITKVNNMYELISFLHWLKMSSNFHSPLIIIDCITSLYFSLFSTDKPIGMALLNHVVSLIRFLTTEYHAVFLITNLASKNYNNIQNYEKILNPCLGRYWFHICDTRLTIEKENNKANVLVNQGCFSSVGQKCIFNLKIN